MIEWIKLFAFLSNLNTCIAPNQLILTLLLKWIHNYAWDFWSLLKQIKLIHHQVYQESDSTQTMVICGQNDFYL